MVQYTLANLQVRYEVELSALYELIERFDRVMNHKDEVSEEDISLNRLFIALLKARTAEEAIDFSHEAIEIHGGNGYIEDFVTPRLLRDAQVLTVWEGTANILGLEVLRLIKKYQVHELFFKEIHKMLNGHSMEQKWMKLVEEKLEKLKHMLIRLDGENQAIQTYHARRIANDMTDIYLSAHAVERVEDERDGIIARLLIDHLFGDHGLDEEMLTVKKFNEIMKPEKKTFVQT